MNTHEFIKQNWKATIKVNKDIPYPYTTPCSGEGFVDFYYWDTYFTNLGLLLDGMEEQALNNIRDFAFFVNKLGFMPNAECILHRSQPPFFTRAVYDYCVHMGTFESFKEFKETLQKEYSFFDNNRMTKLGLYQFWSDEPKDNIDNEYRAFECRLGGYTDEEKAMDKETFVKALLGIAESGWDFNIRFADGGNRFATQNFVHLDLNCILYDAFNKFSFMCEKIGDFALAKEYENKAKNLKELINKYLYDPSQGIYLDYNFDKNKFSSILSAISLYPYAMGISDDKEGALKVFNSLILENGLPCSQFRGDDAKYFQWDYPAMWPSNVYFGYNALKNLGLNECEIIAERYLGTLDKVYDRTGKLWEKYNAKTGDISYSSEYQTPTMMGWTAGVYQYLFSNKK